MPTSNKSKLSEEEIQRKDKNNKVLSLVSLVSPFLMLPVVGIVTGHVALKEYSKENVDKTWKPLALAGTISGYVVLFIKINLMLAFGAFLMASGSHYANPYHHNPYYGMPIQYQMDEAPQVEEYQIPMNPDIRNGNMGSGMGMGSGETTMPMEDGTLMFIDSIPMPAEGESYSSR